jgi:ATP-dependent Clp protease protease subunit
MATQPNRTILVVDEINDDLGRDVLMQFAELDSTPGPITIQIISGGGSTMVGMAMYDIIRQAKNHVVTVGLGEVGSIATLVHAAGHTRLLGSNCSLFLHETSLHIEAGVTQLKQAARETEKLHERYVHLMAARADMSYEKMAEMAKTETYLTATEALALKMADGIWGNYELPQAKKAKRAKR